MKVVSNASPVIIFAKAGLLALIEGLFGEILVFEEVYQEMVVPTKPGVEAIRKAKSIEAGSEGSESVPRFQSLRYEHSGYYSYRPS